MFLFKEGLFLTIMKLSSVLMQSLLPLVSTLKFSKDGGYKVVNDR